IRARTGSPCSRAILACSSSCWRMALASHSAFAAPHQLWAVGFPNILAFNEDVEASRCVFDEKSRVRGRVLVTQEHQPLPSEQCLHVSAHTALQEPLQTLFSVEDMPDGRV